MRGSENDTFRRTLTTEYLSAIIQNIQPLGRKAGERMLETKDLFLRTAQFDDWKDMYRNVWSREETARYMLWQVTTSEEDAMERMLRTIQFQSEHTAWTVFEKKSGQAIGFAGMLPAGDGIYEDCGVALGPEFVGQGYGKQILTALTDHAFEQLGAVAFVATCRTQNAASRGTILSCGFTFTHTEDRIDPRNDTPYVLEFYRLENEERVKQS